MVMLIDDEDDSNNEDSVGDDHDNVSITVIIIISVHIWDININDCQTIMISLQASMSSVRLDLNKYTVKVR